MIARRIAHYEIGERIGKGGMGEVYRARDTRLGRDVALKVLPADKATDPDRLLRFTREAKVVAALNHPNIVTIHSVEEADGLHFLTMELVEGKTLHQLIPEKGLPRLAGEPRQVTHGDGEWHVHNGGWAPDARLVVYTRDTDSGDLYVLDAVE